MNWERVRLGDIVNIRTGKLDANAAVENGEFPFFTCAKEISRIDNYAFDGECVLVAGNGDLNVKYYNGKFNAYQRTYVIQTSNETLDIKYLYYFLEEYLEELRIKSIGGVIKYIKLENLQEPKIPLPPLSVQKEIVEKLDKAAAIREKSKALLSHYDALAESLFIELFGDPISNEKGWEKKKLGEVGNLSSGSTPSREKKSYFLGDIPWVKTTEVKGEIILETEEKISQEALKETSCKLNPKGSIVIAMYGQGKTRGRIGILGIDAATNQACCVIEKNEKVNSVFLFNQLKMLYQDLRNLGRGANQPNLNVGILKDYKILFPPLSLQIKFAEMVENIEEQKARAKAEIEQSEAVFQALLQDSFG